MQRARMLRLAVFPPPPITPPPLDAAEHTEIRRKEQALDARVRALEVEAYMMARAEALLREERRRHERQ